MDDNHTRQILAEADTEPRCTNPEVQRIIDAIPTRGYQYRPKPRVKVERSATELAAEQAERDRDWNGWLDTRLNAALVGFSKVYSEQVINIVFTRMDKQRAERDKQNAELRAEAQELRQELGEQCTRMEAAADSEINKLKAELDKSKAEVRELQAELLKTREVAKASVTILDGQRERINDLRARDAEIAELRNQLTNLRMEFHKVAHRVSLL
jgi:hypothetical protein